MGNLWSKERQSKSASCSEKADLAEDSDPKGVRSEFQQDYDRLLFSTPVRRLADKTQVWPMDENDGVRTRLTHSHEVANLARSIGTRIHKKHNEKFQCIFGDINLYDVIQPILSSIGLAHDLGNPPFGHQGEVAIGRWFENKKNWIFTHKNSEAQGSDRLDVCVEPKCRSEFTRFDGNPQSFRLVTKLQTSHSRLGLDLTAATLAALLKYTVGADGVDSNVPSKKKFGYFHSERSVVDWVRTATGLDEGQRHPMTWIMEACDDIAYSVLDVDDLMKKGIISPDDVCTSLGEKQELKNCETIKRIRDKFKAVASAERRAEISNDIKIGYLRAYVIEELIEHASKNFDKYMNDIKECQHQKSLMDDSALCNAMKETARLYAFSHRDVLKTEAIGAVAVTDLMDEFWHAITDRKDPHEIQSARVGARSRYVYSLISPNYLEAAADAIKDSGDGYRYSELRLLTDMISGMTDSFALKIWRELKAMPHVDRPH